MDADLFAINATTGVLTFIDAPDYEGKEPNKHGDIHSNDYSLTISATDTELAVATQDITVTVTNVEGAPVFLSATSISVAENQTIVTTLTASDDENDQIAFTIGGTDAGAFDLSVDGVLTFKEAPNYEIKTEYSVTVTATEIATVDGAVIDDAYTTDQAMVVSISDVNDAPTLSAIANASTAEDSAYSLDISGNYADEDANDAVTYSITGSSWASIDANGVITGTPTNDAVGTETIIV